MGKNHIVKRGGHVESFDERKLYASVFAAAQSVREPSGSAELIAEATTESVKKWLSFKPEVTSNDIRRVAAAHIKVLHPDAAYMYLKHRVVW